MQTEFKTIPGFSAYEINAAGLARNKKTGFPLKARAGRPGIYQGRDDAGKNRAINAAELTAALFPAKDKGAAVMPPKMPAPAKCAPTDAPAKISAAKISERAKIYLLIARCRLTYKAAGAMIGKNANQASGLYFKAKKDPSALNEAVKFADSIGL